MATLSQSARGGGLSRADALALRQRGSETEQGISKAGNRRARTLLVELAWSWLRYQPQSELSQWFNRRFAGGGKRLRRIGIVALARRLAIALWRYLEHGLIPDGAQLKATASRRSMLLNRARNEAS